MSFFISDAMAQAASGGSSSPGLEGLMLLLHRRHEVREELLRDRHRRLQREAASGYSTDAPLACEIVSVRSRVA